MSNMVVRTNVRSLNSHRNLTMVGSQQAKASARLSSGYRINSAADDAAGLGISEKMRSQIRGLNQASRNAQDGISLIQTAEGAMQTVNEMVLRIRELVVQAANDTNAHDESNAASWSQSDRTKIQDEINQLMNEIDATADRTQFNTRNLIDGALHGLSPSVRQELNTVLASSAATISARQNAENNVRLSEAAIGIAQKNIRLLSDFQSTMNSILGADNVLATLRATGATTAAGAFPLLNTALAEQLNATGMFSTAFATVGFTAAMISADGQNLVSAAGTDHITNDTGARQTVFAAWRTSTTATGGSNLATSVTPGHPTDTATGATAIDFTLANVGDLTTALTAYNGAITAINPILTAQKNSLTTHTNTLNNAIRSNSKLRNYIGDFSTAQAMQNNPGAQALWFQVGANVAQGVNLSVASVNVNSLNRVGAFADSGVPSGFNFSALRTVGTGFASKSTGVMRESGEDINKFITAVDYAISHVLTERSNLGAMQNRLEFTIQNLDISSENLSASESRVRDADMAKEMMRLTQANVLQQAATAMLAQANQAPQSVLQLLG